VPREAKFRLKDLLDERLPGTKNKHVMQRLGIKSEVTLRNYFEDRWTVLDRGVLERAADFIGCELSELVVAAECPFFASFLELSGAERFRGSPTCLCLRRPDADQIITEHGIVRHLGHRDDDALNHVTSLLQNHVDDIRVLKETAISAPEFLERLSQNVIAVGSPRVNPATELAICHALGFTPFAPDAQQLVPFRFHHHHPRQTPASSLTIASDKQGLWLAEEDRLIEGDVLLPQDFKERRIASGRDCGLVLVANQTPEHGHARKLIVLAGAGGTGTEAAAQALVDDFRDLEPLRGERCVWGIVEVEFSKDANSTKSDIEGYVWRYREGGRSPMGLKRRKPVGKEEPRPPSAVNS
jgi:hypothetical protein